MKLNWSEIARLIATLSRVAMNWYQLVNGTNDERDIRRARKAASVVIDPDRPEEDPDEVKDGA